MRVLKRRPVFATLASLATMAAIGAGAPPFKGSVSPLSASERAAMTPSAWRPGCPISLDELRAVRVRHFDLAGRSRIGTLVVNRDAAPAAVKVFASLYAARFPVRKMRPIEAYRGDDFASIEDDNTSAFNCRQATGSSRWSNHAYGRAIDLNPLENPYVSAGRTSHPASVAYLDRVRPKQGMIQDGDVVTRAFDAAGWGWGGRWSGTKDYQHFSADGR